MMITMSLMRCTWQSYHYLDLLSVVCVCCDVAIPDNQTYIAQMLLRDDPVSLSLSLLLTHRPNKRAFYALYDEMRFTHSRKIGPCLPPGGKRQHFMGCLRIWQQRAKFQLPTSIRFGGSRWVRPVEAQALGGRQGRSDRGYIGIYTPKISNRFVHVWDINTCFEIAIIS